MSAQSLPIDPIETCYNLSVLDFSQGRNILESKVKSLPGQNTVFCLTTLLTKIFEGVKNRVF